MGRVQQTGEADERRHVAWKTGEGEEGEEEEEGKEGGKEEEGLEIRDDGKHQCATWKIAVTIVAAHVRHPFVPRLVRQVLVLFGHSEGVHVRSEHDGPRRGRRRSSAENVHDEPGSGHGRVMLENGERNPRLGVESMEDCLASLMLLEAGLGIGVDRAPEVNEPRPGEGHGGRKREGIIESGQTVGLGRIGERDGERWVQ